MSISIILASQSPRRRDLLQLLGLPFQVMVAAADEESVTDPDPVVNVVKTARLKSGLVAAKLANKPSTEPVLVLAADTTVAFAGEMLNKPASPDEAWQMLLRLRGRDHEVHTGYVLLNTVSGEEWQGASTAVVSMRSYADEEIEAYIASGDPFDKAGAYAIQHPTFRPVASLQGCYCNVMGLPVCDLIVDLTRFCGDLFLADKLVDFTAVRQAHSLYSCPTLSRLLAPR